MDYIPLFPAVHALTIQAAVGPPELNQLVRIRGRHWVVSEVLPSTLEPERPQNLVDLTSVEDDGLGDELTVIWEVEPGARVLEKASFPIPRAGRFDLPERLAAFLDALRWGAVTSADSRALQAPFRSGITIEDYQLDPVVRALSMPRVNLLIADDVGLGKTIEAGLVVQEMLLRYRARSVIVVCPASLCLKWQAEMAQKFGLEFRIVDAELVRRLRRERGLAANPWRHFPRLIVSIDWLKMPRAMSLFREILPPDSRTYPRAFDLLVIDEVHTVAPAGRGRYAVDSQRTQTIRELAPHFEHHLYLSATPHNGYQESWTALLELLDPQRFARGVPPKPESVRQIMVRRLKSELRDDPALRRPDGSPRFAERKIDPLEVDYPKHERKTHELLERYTASRRARATHDKAGRRAAEFITLLLKKRLFSSPAAFAKTLDTHRRTLARQAAEASERTLRAAIDRLDEEVDDDEALSDATEEALAAAGASLDAANREEKALLDEMEKWADTWQHRADAKTEKLLGFLDGVCRPAGPDGTRRWNEERVIVFTEYRDTQRYLFDRLAHHLPEGEVAERVAMLYGGMDADDRERIKTEFQAHPSKRPVRILLATDAASEGIDLQLHCHRLVHVETPFSPGRMEQRNGRVDRHGQRAPQVLIYHFVGTGWEAAPPGSVEGDLGFLLLVARKLEQVREDLGNVGPLLADRVEQHMLGDRTAGVDVKPDAKQTASARVLRIERRLVEEVRRLAEAVRESRRELGVTPEAIERVVRVGLEEARQAPLRAVTLDRAGGEKRSTFAVGQLTGSWARTVIDLPDPLTQVVRLEAATRRPAVDRGGRLTAGLDVAGPGEDETALVIAEGEGIVGQHAWTDQDPRGAVVAALAPYRQRLDVVNVDAAGIGYFLAKHLQDLGFPVRPVNVGERATDRERYANLKAELYWGRRQRFQAEEVAGLTDERTIGQLAGIRYRHTARGQVEIERKEDARKRGVKSPDRAEAVMLALARVTSTQMLWDHEVDAEGLVPGRDGYASQIDEAIQDMGWSTRRTEDSPTCATCCHFQAHLRRCVLRDFDVAPSLPGCDFYDVVLSQPT
jgi:superfamily II DNA or RNA helicase